MGIYGNQIPNVVAGTSYTISRSYLNVPQGLYVSSVNLILKASPSDPDTKALLYSMIAVSSTVYGQILDTGSINGVSRFNTIIPGASVNSYTTITGGSNTGITWTAVRNGYSQNKISIAYVVSGLNTSLSVAVFNTAITINVATDGSGNPTTTANQILSLVNSDSVAGVLVQGANASGSDGTGVVSAQSAVFLSFGQIGTANLSANAQYYYYIVLNLSDNTKIEYENGTIIIRAFSDMTPTVTVISTAQASSTHSVRFGNILNNYVDSSLDVFRNLRVWDMEARRSGNDPFTLTFPYKNWNTSFVPEVYDGQDAPIAPNLIDVDYANGTVRVTGDDGYESYYVTYTFDYFGVPTLQAFLQWSLQEMNVAGAANRYLTDYTTVDSTPIGWDGVLTFGVLVKSFQKLAADSGLWRTRCIWADQQGSEGQSLAKEMASMYQETYSQLKESTKWGRFIARPTSAFTQFETVGFGFFSYSGSKWRELQLNKLAAM